MKARLLGVVFGLVVGINLILALSAMQQEQSPEDECPAPDPRRANGGPLTRESVGDAAEGIAPNLLDLPPELRTRNYAGGSCAHAGLIDLFKWHGRHKTAERWRASRHGAYSVWDAARDLERAGFRYAYTTKGDGRLLEWASRNGHGAMIHYYPGHAVTFRGYADGKAYLSDNNRTSKLIELPKDQFIREWKGYGGKAITLVYSPQPPVPLATRGEQ